MIGYDEAEELKTRAETARDLAELRAVVAGFLAAVMQNLQEFADSPGPD